MAKVTELISKPVISLYNCEKSGIVKNVLFDTTKKQVKYLVVYDDIDDIEYVIKTSSIVKIESDAVLIKNNEELELKENLELELTSLNNLVNLDAYNLDGKYLGLVNEIELNDKYLITILSTNKNLNVDTNNIVKIGKMILTSDNKINLNKYKKRAKFVRPKENYKVEIQQGEPKEITYNLPKRLTINENVLIDRLVYNNIYDNMNRLIIKSNTIINSHIIDIAKRHGKLKELIKFSF